MHEYRTKLSENGRVLIPAVVRHQLHLQPGQELIIRVTGHELHLTSWEQSLKKIQSEVKRHAKNRCLSEELIAERRKEARNE